MGHSKVLVKLYLGHAGSPCLVYESSNVQLEAALDSMPYMQPGTSSDSAPDDRTEQGEQPDVLPEDESAEDMPFQPNSISTICSLGG